MLGMYISNIKNKVLNQILKTELENSEKNLSNSVRQLSLCEEKTDKINLAKAELEKNITTLEVENRLLNQKFLEHKTELKELQENLILKFSTSANNLIDEKSQKFTDQNKTSIESLLKPLGENIQRFEELVRQSNNESITRAVSLIEQVKNLSIISAKANKEAENLSRAIKGDIKIQGAWGEIVLERILETAGLVKNREYMVQQ